MSYRASVNIKFKRIHQCAGCGQYYGYEVEASPSGEAYDESRAREKLEADFKQTVEKRIKYKPCPICGTVQPEMCEERNERWTIWASLVALISLISVSVFYFTNESILTKNFELMRQLQTHYSLILGVTLSLYLLIYIYLRSPNDPNQLVKNREKSRKRLEEGKLFLAEVKNGGTDATQVTILESPHIHECPEPTPMNYVRTFRSFRLPLLAILCFTSVYIYAACIKASYNLNAYPPYVGPGEETTLLLRTGIRSIKGDCKGQYVVQGQFTDVPGTFIMAEKNEDENFPYSYSVEPSEKDKDCMLHVELKLTPQMLSESGVPFESVGGKTIQGKIEGKLRYPSVLTYGGGPFSSGEYREVSKPISKTFSLQIAKYPVFFHRLSCGLSFLGWILLIPACVPPEFVNKDSRKKPTMAVDLEYV
ncbi:MAG: hypothetical protein Q4D38_10440 [Planctomycetia bacterium]|nr:hypothetical protein [Planctomycetia bacterium]